MSSSIARSTDMPTATLPFSLGSATVLTESIRRGIAWIRYRGQVRRAIKTLRDFDDHLLADLGLTRDQIKKVACSGHLPGYPQR